MKLFFTKGACSLAVRIVLNELNIPCEYESVDLRTKKTESGQDFLKINPKGAVPTLVLEDGSSLTENSVIQQFLADTYNGESLLPSEHTIKRYRILEWLNFVSTELHKNCAPLFNPTFPEEIKNSFIRPLVKTKLAVAEKQLSTHSYLMGEHFTLPDGYLFVVLNWMPHLGVDLTDCPHLLKAYENLKHRPSIEKSLKQEGLLG